jgi:hypothetical protein
VKPYGVCHADNVASHLATLRGGVDEGVLLVMVSCGVKDSVKSIQVVLVK